MVNSSRPLIYVFTRHLNTSAAESVHFELVPILFSEKASADQQLYRSIGNDSQNDKSAPAVAVIFSLSNKTTWSGLGVDHCLG